MEVGRDLEVGGYEFPCLSGLQAGLIALFQERFEYADPGTHSSDCPSQFIHQWSAQHELIIRHDASFELVMYQCELPDSLAFGCFCLGLLVFTMPVIVPGEPELNPLFQESVSKIIGPGLPIDFSGSVGPKMLVLGATPLN